MHRKIKVALIVDEFFGGSGTAYGGYGFLARNYVARYIPQEDILMDVILGTGKSSKQVEMEQVDGITLYRLPQNDEAALHWLETQNYDVFLSIELTFARVMQLAKSFERKLVLWIQDPRPWDDWLEIHTVKLFPEVCFYNQSIYDAVNTWYIKNKVSFISQGHFLNDKAKNLYRLWDDVAIRYLPNPVEIPPTMNWKGTKKNQVLFLGRLESVKRGWLFCETAKRLPQYEFFVLGKTTREEAKNAEILAPYYNLPNLHFVGHVEGEEKNKYLRESKILMNSSIHEALPVSFLEALAHGTVLVSNRNPEGLTSKFGIWTGQINGDGFEKVHLFVDAIKDLMEDEIRCETLATQGYEYVKKVHNIDCFVRDLREVLRSNVYHEIGSSPYSSTVDKHVRTGPINWLTIRKISGKTKYLLFGFIPILKSTSKGYRFLNVFPISAQSRLGKLAMKMNSN